MSSDKTTGAGRPKSQEKQQQILTSAACLFLKQGFSNTSMDLIANEADVSKQTVYSHFKNKAIGEEYGEAITDMHREIQRQQEEKHHCEPEPPPLMMRYRFS